MKLEAISIKNLRSLVDVQAFRMRPLTLVVGANSSGKSTYLRSFPLLRQSVETITKGPILWFGRFVDFGVFKDAVTRSTPNPEIEFGFSVILGNTLDGQALSYLFQYLDILEELRVDLTLVVAEDPGTSNTYTRQIRLSLADREIELNALPNGRIDSFLLDGVPLKSTITELTLRGGASLFTVAVSRKLTTGSAAASFEQDWLNPRRLSGYSDQLIEHVGTLFHGSTSRRKIVAFTRALGVGSSSSLLAQVKKLAAITPSSLRRIESVSTDSAWIKRLQSLVLADRTPQLLNEIDGFLSATFKDVSYVGPLRATAERFYRHQDLAVNEVDPQGANLAMFLMGLKSSEQVDFSMWCKRSFGFTVEAKPIGSHVSINLRDTTDGSLFNVADMGFGYSQLLPVLATIWRAVNAEPNPTSDWASMRRIMNGPRGEGDKLSKIIAIEQPELHLHPRLQGRLADLLCAIANESEASQAGINLICETHSETIVNQIGKLVASGRINPDHVQVLVFEKESGDSSTRVRSAVFDSEGVLLNWPYGFFLPFDGPIEDLEQR